MYNIILLMHKNEEKMCWSIFFFHIHEYEYGYGIWYDASEDLRASKPSDSIQK